MKKCGVVTWFGGPNYGTVLQAIALQKRLIDLGYISELVNFEPPRVPKRKRKFSLKARDFVLRKVCSFKRRIAYRRFGTFITARDEKMKRAVLEKCTFSPAIENEADYIRICQSYDALVFGSDQIWNPGWFHPFYYADYDGIETSRIAYAPSIGVSRISDSVVEKYRSVLSRFAYIAIREDVGVQFVNQRVGKECKRVVDPTFLLSASEWDSLFEVKEAAEDYVLLYLLNDNRHHIKAAADFSRRKGLTLKVIPYQINTYFVGGDVMADAGPREFLELIKNAKYVLTDSFHGTVFSIIYQKEVYILTRFDDNDCESQNSRIYQIVNEYGLNDRLQQYNTSVIKESGCIRYDLVCKVLTKQIDYSMQYLKEALEGVIEHDK